MGQIEQGQEHLKEFAKVESGFQEAEHRSRDIEAISVAAIRAYKEGKGDAAIKQLNQGIAMYADSDRLQMNLAMVQSRVDQHKDAVKTLESMLDRKLGRQFLVHMNLADEYGILGEAELQRRHRQIYLETREDELLVSAPQ
jgi:predicted Zn-dependent protease